MAVYQYERRSLNSPCQLGSEGNAGERLLPPSVVLHLDVGHVIRLPVGWFSDSVAQH